MTGDDSSKFYPARLEDPTYGILNLWVDNCNLHFTPARAGRPSWSFISASTAKRASRRPWRFFFMCNYWPVEFYVWPRVKPQKSPAALLEVSSPQVIPLCWVRSDLSDANIAWWKSERPESNHSAQWI